LFFVPAVSRTQQLAAKMDSAASLGAYAKRQELIQAAGKNMKRATFRRAPFILFGHSFISSLATLE
jgi:hypothetical protein